MNDEFDLIYDWVLGCNYKLHLFISDDWITEQNKRVSQLIKKHLIK